MFNKNIFDDFVTQIQSDELAAKNGGDWVNDFDDIEEDDEFDND
jgi:hypothetical protein